jgi:hypothetical protein
MRQSKELYVTLRELLIDDESIMEYGKDDLLKIIKEKMRADEYQILTGTYANSILNRFLAYERQKKGGKQFYTFYNEEDGRKYICDMSAETSNEILSQYIKRLEAINRGVALALTRAKKRRRDAMVLDGQLNLYDDTNY